MREKNRGFGLVNVPRYSFDREDLENLQRIIAYFIDLPEAPDKLDSSTLRVAM